MALKLDNAAPPAELTREMCEALEIFNASGLRIEANYHRLNAEVRRLAGELEDSNQALRRNLAEKEKMQAVLISTLQSLTIGVLAVGRDGVVIVANPAACRHLGRPLEEVAARGIDRVLSDIPGTEDLLLTLREAGGSQRQLRASVAQAGQAPRQIELAAVRALPPYDSHLAGVVLLEDTTDLRRLEHQAQMRSRLTGMGEIALNLAHEIRNPLGSIALFATALARDLEADAALGPLAEQIVAGVQSLEHLVANALEFAKPRRMSMTRVDLTEVLAETLIYVSHPLRQKAIALRYDFDLHRQAWIAGDGEQLKQVFLNLMINAIQAMEEGGTLALELRPLVAGGWEVSVGDDGIGIPEELLDKIFDPFFTTREKGSGIGLAVVHTILAAHGAPIEVASRPAAGTTFRISFPAMREFEEG